LGSLVSLQVIELEVRVTSKKLRKCEQVLKIQEQRLEQLRAALKAKHEEIKLTRMQYDKLELDLKSREEEIAKMRVALNSARTNKDYSAILTTINTNKASKSKLEDQILVLINQMEADEAVSKQIVEDIGTEEEHLVELRGTIEQQRAEIQTEAERLAARREAALREVPAEPRAMFERLADRYDGEVLAEVEKMSGSKRGDHLCRGCYIKIPLESVNALMTRDEVVVCPNCGRFLVLDMKASEQPAS